jgi:hypothetical protein
MRTNLNLIVILTVLLTSCASNTISYVKSGEFILSQGRSGISFWNSDLSFKRTSYLSGMTMVFDIMVSSSIKKSDFKRWLSEESLEEVNKCSYPVVIGIFSGRDFKINNHDVFQQILGKEGKFLDSYEFVRNLSFHPSYGKNSFNIYRFELVCLSEEVPVMISLPGFETFRVN